MKIYTKTGDEGKTALIGGRRVWKNDSRVVAYGAVDELNSWLGLLREQTLDDGEGKKTIGYIQEHLFIIGSLLASDSGNSNKRLPVIEEVYITMLENEIDRMDSDLLPLNYFILPGGNLAVSYCHIARCVCRRAEREVVGLASEDFVEPLIVVYLNRLSDFLFTLARKWAALTHTSEIPWNRSKS